MHGTTVKKEFFSVDSADVRPEENSLHSVVWISP